ncbi:Piso0_000943 [Millerozyma farinosa CBS 7064]|uniref:Piso0_000943 protein n=1 Tax=Pichia sorbitophila (strain ATCC MYA-4447 / BCRC 22081 / CBS 7064 / NBRC 10061 / NRRL Y-12695) TaxID=559304 RepID=G8YRY5_PICSO|nr:Piso0_000943 [Millerozyma farinosa CBS 7064]
MEVSKTKHKTSNTFIQDTTETVSSCSDRVSHWEEFLRSFQRHDTDSANGCDGQRMKKCLSKRHLRLMALSTGLGTGLLVASGSKLRTAGPLFLLLGYGVVGFFMLIPCMNAAGELSVAYNNLPGGFQSFYKKFIDEGIAFAIGWNYYFQWANIISLELVTASMVIRFWDTTTNPDIFVAIFLTLIILINLAGARGYGEAEFVMNSIKLLMLFGFIIYGIVVDLGGGPTDFIGGKYWKQPGAYTNFKGLCSVFVTSAFSLGGTEFISLTASEQRDPRKAIPSACKLVFFRIAVLFMGPLALIGLLVPHDSSRLMGSDSSTVHSSPFVIAAELYGVKVLPHIFNSVILLSTISVATAAMYSAPRLLQSLAEQGYAPRYFDYIDRKGRPLRGWLLTILLSCFGFIATYKDQETVFNWLLSISGLSFLFVWGGINICHIRFRAALHYNNIPVSSLGYASPTGLIGSYISLIFCVLILIGQFWLGLSSTTDGQSPSIKNFFENSLGAFVVLAFYLGHKIYTKNWSLLIKIKDIDIDADRTIYDQEILNCEKEEAYSKTPRLWRKIASLSIT